MRSAILLLSILLCLVSRAQHHDTIRTHWVYDTLNLYERDIKDMSDSDTLTLVPIYGSWHYWCCMGVMYPHDGWVLGVSYDYATSFGVHSGGLSVGRFLPAADLMLEVEAQTNANADVYDIGISAWRNMLYIPVASGALEFPLLRPGIKVGTGSNYGNRYFYYEPKIALVLPYGRAHVYYAHHQPFSTGFVGGQIWHQIGLTYYFML